MSFDPLKGSTENWNTGVFNNTLNYLSFLFTIAKTEAAGLLDWIVPNPFWYRREIGTMRLLVVATLAFLQCATSFIISPLLVITSRTVAPVLSVGEDSRGNNDANSSDENTDMPSFSEWKTAFVANRMGNPARATVTSRSAQSSVTRKRVPPTASKKDVAHGETKHTDEQATIVNNSPTDEVINTSSSTSAESIDSQSGDSDVFEKLKRLRVATCGNSLRYDGTTIDSPSNREQWGKIAPEILIELPGDPYESGQLASSYAEAIMYNTACKGILKAISTGEAFSYLKAVDVLVSKFPDYDNGVAYIYRGAYFLAAPWPIRNVSKAIAAFTSAVEKQPLSRRNLYYLGMAYLAGGQKQKAAEFFGRSVQAECMSSTEEDIADFLLTEAKRGLQATQT